MSPKVVVITGAAGGIGSALSLRFLKEGWQVAGLDLDARLFNQNRDVFDGFAEQMLTLACDVTNSADCQSALKAVVQKWRRVDILINNAGITHRSAFADTELAVFRKVMDINYFGALNMAHFALPHLIKSAGLIVTISSISGFSPLFGRSGYSASKYALHGLFESLRTEVKPQNVAVMMVCPGFTNTAIDKNALDGDGRPNQHPRSTTGRIESPDSVADKIYRGAMQRKRLLVLSPIGKIAYWVSRFAPGFYEMMMARNLKQELNRD